MQLTSCQQSALEALMAFLISPEQCFVIAGPAGTGKTALIAQAHKHYKKVSELNMVIDPDFKPMQWHFTATTNKAAAVLSEALDTPCSTIHSFLGLSLKTKLGKKESSLVQTRSPQGTGIVVIDEASFIDRALLKRLFENLPHAKLVFMGDPAQLTPVRSPDSPVFNCGFQTATLNEIVRQRDQLDLQDVCEGLRNTVLTQGRFPKIPLGGALIHLNQDDFEEALKDNFLNPDWVPEHSRVLCWRNRTVQFYNQLIQKERTGSIQLAAGDWAVNNESLAGLRTDTKLIVEDCQPATQFEVPGYRIHTSHGVWFCPEDFSKKEQVIAEFLATNDHYNALSVQNTWADIRPLFSSTVNKSQGSTFEKVFIDLDDIACCRNPDTLRRMLYVAVSRARKQVIFTGDLV